MYRLTESQLRLNLQQFEDRLRTEPNSQIARTIATNIAKSFEDQKLSALVRSIPTPNLATGFGAGAGSPFGRDARFDNGIMDFIKSCYAALEVRASLEARITENAHLSGSKCNTLVLKELNRTRERETTWSLTERLALSDRQVSDAIEELLRDGAIDADRAISLDSSDSEWHGIRIVAKGRLLLENRLESENRFPITLNYHFSDGANVVSAGIARDVTQNITLPAIPADVRGALESIPEGREALEMFDDESTSKTPKPKTLKMLASQIKMVIEAASVSTEVAVHAHEWYGAMSHILGMLGQ